MQSGLMQPTCVSIQELKDVHVQVIIHRLSMDRVNALPEITIPAVWTTVYSVNTLTLYTLSLSISWCHAFCSCFNGKGEIKCWGLGMPFIFVSDWTCYHFQNMLSVLVLMERYPRYKRKRDHWHSLWAILRDSGSGRRLRAGKCGLWLSSLLRSVCNEHFQVLGVWLSII